MAVAFLKVSNNAESTLAEAALVGATEIKAVSTASFPTAYPFDVTIDKEILHVTGLSGEKWTCTRAAQGTVAAQHSLGAAVQLNVTAKSITDLDEAVNNVELGVTDLMSYAKLAGRVGGQELIGGAAAGNNLTLKSTSNATKGKIVFGTSAYLDSTNFLGIGTAAPTAYLQVEGPKAEPFQAAPTVLKVTGAEGGEASGEEVGGEGSAISMFAGKGGPSTVVGSATIAGGGGGGTFSAGLGGIANGANTQNNQGGKGGGFSFIAAAGGAALNSTAINLAGEGGTLTFTGGKGGNAEGAAGTREGARGGAIVMEAGPGGTGTAKGGPGGALLMEAGKNNRAPGPTDGIIQLKAGAGAAAIAGGNIELLTYKESVTVGAQMIVNATGELVFKNESNKTRLTIGATGKIGLYAAAPVSQAAAITKIAVAEGTPKELTEKVNAIIKAIAAGEGGIGIAA